MSESKSFRLDIWRQKNDHTPGKLETYAIDGVTSDMSLLEMLDMLNDNLLKRGIDPVAFDSDCREGICGACGLVINGIAHGPKLATTTCEVRMRLFAHGSTITIEPFRAKAFPVVKDLVVDRAAFDRIMSAGGYVSVRTGSAPDGNAILIPKPIADLAMDAASCIGCGACVAACPNASASLFVGAKVSQLALLPQGKGEAARRVSRMVAQMDAEEFGACSNHGECEAVCPKEISISHISKLRREYFKASLF